MNEETMRKHYETTPKDILINILISARKEFDKLQNRNKECKQEIERLNNIINELEKTISLDFNYVNNDLSDNFVLGIRNEAKFIYRELQELKGNDKGDE